MKSTLCPSCGAGNLEGLDECANCGEDLRAVDIPKPESKVEKSIMSLPLTTLQFTRTPTIPATETLERAVQQLAEKSLDLLQVVEAGKLIGVLSSRDVLVRAGANYAQSRQRPVREFMTPSVDYLPPDAPISFALNRMDVGGYRHVPVVQDGHLMGVLSSRDVVDYLLKQTQD